MIDDVLQRILSEVTAVLSNANRLYDLCYEITNKDAEWNTESAIKQVTYTEL